MNKHISILIACLLMAWCTGCVRVTAPGFEYLRIGNQQIGEALLTLPDGSELLLDGQKSTVPTVTVTLPVGALKVGGVE